MQNPRAVHGILLAILVVCARPLLAVEDSAGGISWSVPARWSAQPGRPMRSATYSVPAEKGGEAAECAVFFFREGQGGGIDENIERWSKQFEGNPQPSTQVRTIGDRKVHIAEISGTYLSPGGPMMQSQGKKSGWRLLGAIVEADRGLVFFKMIGPSATVAGAKSDFDRMLGSLKKAGSASL